MTFYRYEWRIDYNGFVRINLIEFNILRETPKGYWIIKKSYNNYPESIVEKYKKWVRKDIYRSSFAYPNKHRAWLNLHKRTKKYKKILESKLKDVNSVLSEIRKTEEKWQKEQNITEFLH